eukprot:TRINITY_DN6534_c0_g2_i4.p1 TRINITY_DN6534_c0_g2~~TRINITY_DN6534_c0_g2_i4.p1  ORF type:complete len:319 (-),score=44.85 TRINITY_DN6534_c0_g2_i4:125-1021(-)
MCIRDRHPNFGAQLRLGQNILGGSLLPSQAFPLNFGQTLLSDFASLQRLAPTFSLPRTQPQTLFSDELVQQTLLTVLDYSRNLKALTETCMKMSEKLTSLEEKIQSFGPGISSPQSTLSLVGHEAKATSNPFYSEEKAFDFFLVLQTENFPKIIFRDRNFNLSVKITDAEGNVVENQNKISLKVFLYSSEDHPKPIMTNTLGKHILKGLSEKDVINGEANFEKIRISEVTSHLPKGWMYLVVSPTSISDQVRIMYSNPRSKIVEPSRIKPLVIEKVIVKAKKYKNTGSHSKNKQVPRQ